MKSKRLSIALGVTFSCVLCFILLLGMVYWRREKRRRLFMMKINDTHEVGQIKLGNLRTFTFKELYNATDDFSSKNILGSGGFGNVYKYELLGAMLDWVKKIQQEEKVEVLVDRELGANYDRIEVGEMLQLALLCTQYLPAHRPKMSEVVLCSREMG